MAPTEARPLCSATRSRVVVTGSKVTALNTLSAMGEVLAFGASTKALPFQYWTVQDAGSRTPPPSSRK
jgi:hypothetical protein